MWYFDNELSIRDVFMVVLRLLSCLIFLAVVMATPMCYMASFIVISDDIVPYFSGFLILSSFICVLSLFVSRFRAVASLMLFLSAACSWAYLGLVIYETNLHLDEYHWGVNNLFQVSVLLAAMVTTFGFFFDKKQGFKGLSSLIGLLLLGSAGMILWLHGLGESGPKPLVPALRSYWLPWHVLANFIGYSCFMIAAAGGVIELIQRKWQFQKLLSKEEARSFTITAIEIGFPVFSLAIFLGSLWAYEAWGGYWSWDPKETWALIVWLVYACFLHMRYTPYSSSILLPIWAILGFFVTLFCYLGVNLFLDGLHSYGTLN